MKKQSNNELNSSLPFANETKQAKYDFIKMIESMPDNEFEDFIVLFFDFLDEYDFLAEDYE